MSELIAGWGFTIIAILGGIVAHIQNYEINKIEMTPAQHFWAIMRRSIMGGFGGSLVFFVWHGGGWPESYGYFVAGLVGVFSAQAFEWMWGIVRKLVEKKIGV